MRQYQHLAKLAGIQWANDFDLYDAFADVICPAWGIVESLADMTENEFWFSLVQLKLGLSDIDAMLTDYREAVFAPIDMSV